MLESIVNQFGEEVFDRLPELRYQVISKWFYIIFQKNQHKIAKNVWYNKILSKSFVGVVVKI